MVGWLSLCKIHNLVQITWDISCFFIFFFVPDRNGIGGVFDPAGFQLVLLKEIICCCVNETAATNQKMIVKQIHLTCNCLRRWIGISLSSLSSIFWSAFKSIPQPNWRTLNASASTSVTNSRKEMRHISFASSLSKPLSNDKIIYYV